MREFEGLKRLIAPTAALALFGAVACSDGGKDDTDTDTDASVEPTDDDDNNDDDDDNNDDDNSDDDELTAADVRRAIRDLCTAAEACGELEGTVDQCVDAYEEDIPQIFDEDDQDCIDAAVAFFSCAAEAGSDSCSETDGDTGEVSFECPDEELYEDAILSCFPEDTDAQDTADTAPGGVSM